MYVSETGSVNCISIMYVSETGSVNCISIVFQLPGHISVYINEPKLSDFKIVLLQEGIQAEFSAGALVCNDTIAVRRVSTLHLLSSSI